MKQIPGMNRNCLKNAKVTTQIWLLFTAFFIVTYIFLANLIVLNKKISSLYHKSKDKEGFAFRFSMSTVIKCNNG